MRPGRAKPGSGAGAALVKLVTSSGGIQGGGEGGHTGPPLLQQRQVLPPSAESRGGGQLAVIVQQTGRPDAPAAVSSVLPPNSARVSRLRLIFFAFFFILCSFRIVAVILGIVRIVPHLAEGGFRSALKRSAARCPETPSNLSPYRSRIKDSHKRSQNRPDLFVVRLRRSISRYDGLPPRTTIRRSRRQSVVPREKPSQPYDGPSYIEADRRKQRQLVVGPGGPSYREADRRSPRKTVVPRGGSSYAEANRRNLTTVRRTRRQLVVRGEKPS